MSVFSTVPRKNVTLEPKHRLDAILQRLALFDI